MKIIIIGPAHPLRGGIADSTEAMCQNFLKSGHECEIISFSLQYPAILFPGKTQLTADDPPKDLVIHSLINSINPISWLKTASFINKYRPDLVIIRYWIPFLAPCLAVIVRKVGSKSVTIAVCDNIIPHENRPGDRLLTNYFIRGCHGFVTFSNKVADEIRDFTDKVVSVHPLPMDTKFPPPVPMGEARKKLGLRKDGKYLLFFGLVRDYKGLDLLLESLASTKLTDKEIVLLVAGEFYHDKNIYVDQIERLKLKNNVIIRDEFIPSAEIGLYFSAVDLITQTYKTASQSGVTQIAYYYDRPMLVTDVGGLSETVPHNKVGYVLEKDPEKIAGAINDFYENERFTEFSRNVSRLKERYTWDKFRENILELYHTLLLQQRSPNNE